MISLGHKTILQPDQVKFIKSTIDCKGDIDLHWATIADDDGVKRIEIYNPNFISVRNEDGFLEELDTMDYEIETDTRGLIWEEKFDVVRLVVDVDRREITVEVENGC